MIWQWRFVSFVIKIKNLGIEQPEELIQQQVEAFKKYKEKIWQ